MTAYRFRSLALARSFRDRAVKIMLIVHGDDGRFWVTTPAAATRLQRAGHEIVG